MGRRAGFDNWVTRQPCANCPFRDNDLRASLGRERRAEIAQSLEAGDNFHCHATIDYSSGEDEGYVDPHGSLSCSGAIAVLNRGGGSTQLQRIAERLGGQQATDPGTELVPYADLEHWVGTGESLGTGEPCSVCGPSCEHPAGWGAGGGVSTNYVADAPHQCWGCAEPVCDACSVPNPDGTDTVLCDYCQES